MRVPLSSRHPGRTHRIRLLKRTCQWFGELVLRDFSEPGRFFWRSAQSDSGWSLEILARMLDFYYNRSGIDCTRADFKFIDRFVKFDAAG